MKTLERALAFNAGYRNNWKDYYGKFTLKDIDCKLEELTRNLDKQSRDLCLFQAGIAPYCFPHQLISHLFVLGNFPKSLLPKETIEALERAGYYNNQRELLEKIQIRLDYPDELLPEMLLHSGLRYVPEHAKRYVTGKTIVDGGGYRGDTASLFARLYNPKQIWVFEPDPGSFTIMKDFISEKGLSNLVKVRQEALSDSKGSDTLWGEGLGASSVKKVAENPISSIKVSTNSIDAFVEDNAIDQIGFIKLDIEGKEWKAISGAIETIKRDKPLMIISVYHTAVDFFEIKPELEKLELGYKFLFRKLTDDLFKELVLICVPPEAAL